MPRSLLRETRVLAGVARVLHCRKNVGGHSGPFGNVGPRSKRKRRRQVTKLGRVERTEDRRKGWASIDTLEVNVDITMRDRREEHERSIVKAFARCTEKNPREPKLKRGSRICDGYILEQIQRIDGWIRP